jgi:hypothetical protein
MFVFAIVDVLFLFLGTFLTFLNNQIILSIIIFLSPLNIFFWEPRSLPKILRPFFLSKSPQFVRISPRLLIFLPVYSAEFSALWYFQHCLSFCPTLMPSKTSFMAFMRWSLFFILAIWYFFILEYSEVEMERKAYFL